MVNFEILGHNFFDPPIRGNVNQQETHELKQVTDDLIMSGKRAANFSICFCWDNARNLKFKFKFKSKNF